MTNKIYLDFSSVASRSFLCPRLITSSPLTSRLLAFLCLLSRIIFGFSPPPIPSSATSAAIVPRLGRLSTFLKSFPSGEDSSSLPSLHYPRFNYLFWRTHKKLLLVRFHQLVTICNLLQCGCLEIPNNHFLTCSFFIEFAAFL